MDPRARELLDRIVADPSDLEARLVYADVVGGERGEWIVLAARLEGAGIRSLDDLVFAPAAAELGALATQLRRFEKLERVQGAAYAEAANFMGTTPHGGFITSAEVDCEELLDELPAILAAEPVTRLAVTLADAALLHRLATLPLHRIRDLELRAFPHGDPAVATLVAAMPELQRVVFEWAPEPADLVALAHHERLFELEITSPADAMLDALAKTPLAARLHRIVLAGHRHGRDRREHVLDRATALFDGRFANARAIELHWLTLTGDPDRIRALPERVVARGSTIPPATLAALARHGRPLRHLDLSYVPLETPILDELATHALGLRELAFSCLRIAPGSTHALAALPLARVTCTEVGTPQIPSIATLVHDHDLESLDVTADGRVDTALARSIVDAPRARSLRLLKLVRADFDAELARATASRLSQLRCLDVFESRSPTGLAGMAALAELPSLVYLRVRDQVTRPIAALVAHPTLVSYDLASFMTPALREASRERFATSAWGPDHAVLFVDAARAPIDIASVVSRFDLVRWDQLRELLGITDGADVDLDIRRSHDEHVAQQAADIASGETVQRIAAATHVLQLSCDQGERVRPLYRAIRERLGCVLWDQLDDSIVDEP